MEKIKIYVGGNIETLNKVCEKLTKLGYRYTGTTPARLNVNNDAVYAGGMHGPIISFRRFMPKYTFNAVDDGYRRVTVEELMRMESNEFKEFLDPSDWSLKLVGTYEVYPENWIEVPEGAERLYDFLDGYEFHKNGNELYWNEHEKKWMERGYNVASHVKMLWQRHTQPEPLPFIDDEPPAYYGNAVRPKPRKRVYAVLGKRNQPVRTVNMKLSIDSREFSEACKAAAAGIRKAVQETVKILNEINRGK